MNTLQSRQGFRGSIGGNKCLEDRGCESRIKNELSARWLINETTYVIRPHSITAWYSLGSCLIFGVCFTAANIRVRPSTGAQSIHCYMYHHLLLPIMSPLTALTEPLSPSTLAAISAANCLLPSSRTWSASSLRFASSSSSGDNRVGPLSRNDLSTGEEAIVALVIRECKYARRVMRFFSRARRDALALEDDDGPLPRYESALPVVSERRND